LKKRHTSSSSSSSSSDEESRQRKEEHRRKREEDKRRAEDRVINDAKNSRADTRYNELQSHLGRKKFRNGAAVMLILVSLASYFLILNLLNKNLFTHIVSGVGDLQIIYGRLQCTEDVISNY
jgi:lysyl-tRNA synthetase class II